MPQIPEELFTLRLLSLIPPFQLRPWVSTHTNHRLDLNFKVKSIRSLFNRQIIQLHNFASLPTSRISR
jgi:hypothetical protein